MATVEIQGLPELIARFKSMPDHLKADADEAIRDVADGMQRSVQAQYVQGPTGALKRGVRVRRRAAMHYQVRAGARHTALYERGSKPRFTKSGAHRGSMPAAGDIFEEARTVWQRQFFRDCEAILRGMVQGTRSPGGGGLL